MEKSLMQLVHDTETKTIQYNELISQKILKELEQKLDIFFEMKNLDFLIFLLKNPQFKGRFLLIDLLEKYHINERDLLFYLTINLFSSSCPASQVDKLIYLPYIKSIFEGPHYYQIKTKYGKIDMYCLEDWLLNHTINFQSKRFNGLCHHAVRVLAPSFKEEYITTSEFESLFGGLYYHSYYTLRDGGVVDPARNIFYPNSCFEEVFQPKVILQYPAKELEERYQDYQKRELEEDKDLVTVLALALDQKRKLLK